MKFSSDIFCVRVDAFRPVFGVLIFLCLFAGESFGQVKGQVRDVAGQPVAFANVLLRLAADSSLVKGVVADAEGHFGFLEVAMGRYLLTASMVGYRPVTQAVLVDGKPLEVRLVLEEDVRQLGEVKVEALRPLVEQQADRMVVNVENSAISTGGSALDVLRRAPNVTIDREGNISLKGRENVQVMIDGKLTYLSGKDLQNLLKNLPASQISQLELMSNPSAKYDAAGNAGIIHIRLKKNAYYGQNAAVTLNYGQGRYEKPGGSLTANWRNSRMNGFVTYSMQRERNWDRFWFYRRYAGAQGGGDPAIDQFMEGTYIDRTHSLKTGVDLNIGEKNTLGLTLNGQDYRQDWGSVTNTDLLRADNSLASATRTQERTLMDWRNYGLNTHFRRAIDSTGREWSAEWDMSRFEDRNTQRYDNTYLNADRQPTGVEDPLSGRTDNGMNLYMAKTDYVHPVDSTFKVETGAKASLADIHSRLDFFGIRNGREEFDALRSSTFAYREQISAAYLNAQKRWGKWSLQAGLRYEHTYGEGSQPGTDLRFVRDYGYLFPSVSGTWQAGSRHQWGASYSYRIDRPDYRALNPFRFFLDPFTIWQGNPYLLPQLTHSWELNHTYRETFITGISHSRTTAVMADVVYQDTTNDLTVSTRANLGLFENYGLNFTLPVEVTKWWNSMLNLNLFVNQYTGGTRADVPFNQQRASFTANTNQQFVLGAGWTAELTAYYNSRSASGTFTDLPMGAVAIGMEKKLWQDKASLRLNLTDMFRTEYWRGTNNYQGVDTYMRFNWDSRVLTASFTWKVGNMQVAAPKTDEEEKESGGGRRK